MFVTVRSNNNNKNNHHQKTARVTSQRESLALWKVTRGFSLQGEVWNSTRRLTVCVWHKNTYGYSVVHSEKHTERAGEAHLRSTAVWQEPRWRTDVHTHIHTQMLVLPGWNVGCMWGVGQKHMFTLVWHDSTVQVCTMDTSTEDEMDTNPEASDTVTRPWEDTPMKWLL